VTDLPISKLITCLGPRDSGVPPKVRKNIVVPQDSGGPGPMWAKPGGLQDVVSYVTNYGAVDEDRVDKV